MKSQPVEFFDSIEADLSHAQEFYASWLTDGARIFRDKFRETISWIEWNPEMFSKAHGHFRRAIIRKTYFAIYYAIEADKTLVVAVLDMRQNPHFIRAILGQRWIGES